ncbi:MAG: hypothetical protein R3C45_12395 [Phycisphaerales bacterium]
MGHKNTIVAATLIGMITAAGASAQVDLDVDSVNNLSQLTGHVTQDLKVDTEDDWFGAAIVLELDEGSIYQDGFGNDTAPDPYFFSYYPSLEFDTYMAGGSMGVGVLGPGGDAGGHDQQFDDERLDASWKSNGSNEIGVTQIARITLSDDAAGRWRLAVFQSGDETRYDFSGTITDGVMTIDP